MVPHHLEGPAHFARRRYCSVPCANRGKANRRAGHVWTDRKPTPHQRMYGAHRRSRQRGTSAVGEYVYYWQVDALPTDGAYGARCMRCQETRTFLVSEW